LFTHFQKSEPTEDLSIQLQRLGIYSLLEKGKIAFIDGPNYQPIFGLQHYGAEVARIEDNRFFNVALTANVPVLHGSNSIELLERAVIAIKEEGFMPSIIIVGTEYLYGQHEIQSSLAFNNAIPQIFAELGIGRYFIGSFDDIPVLTVQNDYLAGTFIVGDFAETYLRMYRFDESWIEGELNVSVEMPSEDMINEIYTRDPMKWRRSEGDIELSEQEAKTLIATSVLIDIEAKTDFYIINANSCRICKVEAAEH
jgi:hypothetical protein